MVQARGTDYAKITSPVRIRERDHYFAGRILLWTDINLQGPWVDLANEDELSPDQKKSIAIPINARPNYRTFDYVFDNQRHDFWFEASSSMNQNLGATTAKRVLARLVSPEVLGADHPTIEVSIIPEEGAVDKILAMPRLQSLFIRVVRPNPDYSSPAARKRVEDRLRAAGAQKEELTLTKARDAIKLTPPDDVIERARVAADTGLVRGEERQEDGRKVVLSTDALPQRIQIANDGDRSLVESLVSFLRRR